MNYVILIPRLPPQAAPVRGPGQQHLDPSSLPDKTKNYKHNYKHSSISTIPWVQPSRINTNANVLLYRASPPQAAPVRGPGQQHLGPTTRPDLLLARMQYRRGGEQYRRRGKQYRRGGEHYRRGGEQYRGGGKQYRGGTKRAGGPPAK